MCKQHPADPSLQWGLFSAAFPVMTLDKLIFELESMHVAYGGAVCVYFGGEGWERTLASAFA